MSSIALLTHCLIIYGSLILKLLQELKPAEIEHNRLETNLRTTKTQLLAERKRLSDLEREMYEYTNKKSSKSQYTSDNYFRNDSARRIKCGSSCSTFTKDMDTSDKTRAINLTKEKIASLERTIASIQLDLTRQRRLIDTLKRQG